MRKLLKGNILRFAQAEPAVRRATPSTRRGAFTLAELVVAVGILALMMALAGEMFSIAVRSTGQATALTNVNQRLRMVEHTLREDLSRVNRESSLMVVFGNPRNYWTQAGYDADDANKDPQDGYPHVSDPEREELDKNGNLRMVAPRADILMFVTQRQGVRSAVYTDLTANAQQVIYGHALQTEYRADNSARSGYRSQLNPSDVVARNKLSFRGEEEVRQFPLEGRDPPSRLPASQWHLARRAVLLSSDEPPIPSPGVQPWQTQLFDDGPNEDGDWPLLAGLTDVVGNFKYDQVTLPGIAIPHSGEQIGWDTLVENGKALDYVVSGRWARRSVLDLTPPAPIGDRIANYFLPRCASFKVEWTIDPQLYDEDLPNSALRGAGDRVLWFDTDYTIDASRVFRPIDAELDRLEDLLNQAVSPYERAAAAPPGPGSALRGRFVDDSRFPVANNGNFEDFPGIFWHPRLVETLDNGKDPKVIDGEPVTEADWAYPYALRITIDVYDQNLRLDRPLRHVMVIPLGT